MYNYTIASIPVARPEDVVMNSLIGALVTSDVKSCRSTTATPSASDTDVGVSNSSRATKK